MVEEYPPVLTKQNFVRRYKQGEFGNHSPTWDSIEDWLYDKHIAWMDDIRFVKGLFHIRNRIAGGITYYNLTANQVVTEWYKLKKPSNFYLSSMAPHHKNLIQGELLVDGGWYLTYSDEPNLPMRDALAKCTKTAIGIMAYELIKSAFCPNSWEWLQVLLTHYEKHVIEFSSFSIPWGTLPHYNTCFWEVRIGY